MANAFSIDLASKRYRDFGMALLPEGGTPQLIKPADLGLKNPPRSAEYAERVDAFCRQQDVGLLLLDGPQGWRLPQSPIEHMRLCERAFNTPGKTGVPGTAKPKTYLAYITFSVEVFHDLHFKHGWNLLQRGWKRNRASRLAVEVYPSIAWTLLGLQRLPGKARANELDSYRRALAQVTGWDLPAGITHDELQAIVVLPLAQSIASGEEHSVLTAGVDPIVKEQTIYEGLIASPRHPPR